MENPFINRINGVVYSCYTRMSRVGENFIPEHVFTYIESGSLSINDGTEEYVLNAGDFAFYAKNQLAKFTKLPSADNSEYKSLSILLDSDMLGKLKPAFINARTNNETLPGIIKLDKNPLFDGFAQSVIAYINGHKEYNSQLMEIKVQEAAIILLEAMPQLATVLFNFSAPGKIDLKDFMLRNFAFNVSLERFAFLTGRSLSTFKRDFEKIFNTTPARWLVQKRLEEAYYLITKKGKTATEVYTEVGFENLSHFSFAFKKVFGKAPTQFT